MDTEIGMCPSRRGHMVGRLGRLYQNVKHFNGRKVV